VVGIGLLLQFVFAALVLHAPPVRWAIDGVGSFFIMLLSFSRDGAGFLFGSLLDEKQHGMVFAFSILPSIICFSALTSALYYLGILQKVVLAIAWVVTKTMRLSGPETLSASANVFVGQTEAPLVIKPYLPRMTRSEIFCVMVGGMATVAGGVLIAYIGLLGGTDPAQQLVFATHLITKSVITVPAALMIAKILIPQTGPADSSLHIDSGQTHCNLLDAIFAGSTDGVKLAVNVGAMLIVFTALIALVNHILSQWIGAPLGLNTLVASLSGGVFEKFSLEFLFGLLFAPVAWLMGIGSSGGRCRRCQRRWCLGRWHELASGDSALGAARPLGIAAVQRVSGLGALRRDGAGVAAGAPGLGRFRFLFLPGVVAFELSGPARAGRGGFTSRAEHADPAASRREVVVFRRVDAEGGARSGCFWRLRSGIAGRLGGLQTGGARQQGRGEGLSGCGGAAAPRDGAGKDARVRRRGLPRGISRGCLPEEPDMVRVTGVGNDPGGGPG
jgi:nucleoside transporter